MSAQTKEREPVDGPGERAPTGRPDNDRLACVVIPCFNGEATIALTLQSLNNQTVRDRLRVVVVDNGSTDASVQIASGLADEVLRGPGTQPFAARNVGLSVVTEPIYLSLDADCVPCSDTWAESHIRALQAAGSDVAGSAGPLLPAPSDDRWASRADATPHPAFADGSPQYAVGGNGAMWTATLREVGGFPAFRADDVALGRRLRGEGRSFVWVPEAGVFHRNPPGAASYFRQMRKVGWYATEAEPERKGAAAYGLLVAKGTWWIAKEWVTSGYHEGLATTLKVAGHHAGYWDHVRATRQQSLS